MAKVEASPLENAFRSLNLEATAKDFFNNYYVSRKDSPVNSLKNDIMNTNAIAKVLFSGHRGSGKTTELYNLQNMLEKEGFLVVFVAATKDMNVSDLYYTDVLLTLIKNSIEFVSAKIKLSKKQSKKLEELLKQLAGELVKEDIIEKKTQFSLKYITDWVGVFFNRDRTTRQTIRLKADSLVHELITTFNSMISSIEEASGRKIVIIVDDLEKVTDEGRMIDILLKHSNVIRLLNCHIVLTVPPSISYSPSARQISQTYGITPFLPPFKVHNKDGTYNIDQISQMETIIRKRVSISLIASQLVQDTAKQSGGLLTDFIRILKVSFNKAYNIGENYVNDSVLNEAFNNLIDEYDKIVSSDDYEILIEVHRKKDVDNKDAKFRDLLFNLIILQYYERGMSWYDLHPAVEQLLKNKNKM